MAITRATNTQAFNGQSYLIIFDEVADYNTATIDAILKNGIDLGQIFEGSTTPNGDEASFDDKKDEQGDIIVSVATKGTDGFDFEMADFSAQKLMKFMKARKIDHTASTSTSDGVAIGGEVIGWGDKMPVLEVPIGLFDETESKVMIYPKARILTSRAAQDKLFTLKCTAKAQDCNTEHLNTVMYADKVKLNFASTTEGE